MATKPCQRAGLNDHPENLNAKSYDLVRPISRFWAGSNLEHPKDNTKLNHSSLLPRSAKLGCEKCGPKNDAVARYCLYSSSAWHDISRAVCHENERIYAVDRIQARKRRPGILTLVQWPWTKRVMIHVRNSISLITALMHEYLDSHETSIS